MRFWRRDKAAVDTDQQARSPRVTAIQWLLVSVPVIIAAASYDATRYQVLAVVAEILAFFNLVLLAVVARESLQTRLIGKSCLVAGTLVFFWIEALALALQKNPFSIPEGFPIGTTQFDQELITLAFVYVSLFQFFLFVGYSIQPRFETVSRFCAARIDSLSFDRWLVGFLLVMCAVLPLFIYYEFDYDKIISALLASRSSTDFEAAEPGLAQHLAIFGIYGAALFLVYALKTSTWHRLWWLVLGVIAALPFVMSGSRHLWLYISFPSLLIVLRGFKRKLDPRRIIAFTAVLFFVLLVAQAQFVYRTVGWGEVRNIPAEELSQLNNNGQLSSLMFAEHLVPYEHDYFMEAAEPFFFTHWIPRQLWPQKPVMESWLFYNESYVQGATFNVTPSVIGQYHLNWGFPGVMFIGAWLGFLTFLADRVLLLLDSDRQRAMFVVLGMFYAFIISSFRFYSPVYFSYFLFGVLAMFLLTRRRGLPNVEANLAPQLAVGRVLSSDYSQALK